MSFLNNCLLKFHKVTFNFMLWQIKKEITASKINYSKTDRVMRKLYFLITLSVQIADEKKSYLAIDLLKLAFGEKFIRIEEPLHLFSLCNDLLSKKKTVVLSYLLDSYKPLVRNINTNQIIEIINNLNTLSNLLSRDKEKSYFISKIITLIINNMEYFCKDDILQIALSLLIKNIGIVAIKENDMALYCEVNVCFIKTINYFSDSKLSNEVAEIISVWFYYITKKKNKEFIISFKSLLFEIIKEDEFSYEVAYRVLPKIKSSMIFLEYNVNDEFVKEACGMYSDIINHGVKYNLFNTIDEIIGLSKLTVEKYGIEKSYAIIILLNLLVKLIDEKDCDIDKVLLKIVLFLEFIKVSQNIDDNSQAVDKLINILAIKYSDNNYYDLSSALIGKWSELK